MIVVATGMIKPELDRMMEKRALFLSKQALFNNQKEAVEQVQELIQAFQGFAKLQETVSLAMPRDEQTTQILNQLDAIARTAGVTMSSFDVNPKAFETSKQPLARRLGTVEIGMSVEGGYEQMKQFLQFLETNVRIFSVQRLIFSQAGGFGASTESYRFSLTVDSYFQD